MDELADLTRFDFHALKFTKSYRIRSMSLEEVGQYIFLLSEAWLANKETTLPDDLEILSQLARCKKVSEKVLTMFPVTDTPFGQARRNETLYGEWMATQERLELAKESGRRGGEARKAAYSQPVGTLSGNRDFPSSEPQAITKPTRTDSNQTNKNTYSGQCSFKNISIQYSSYFGISHSKNKRHVEKYQAACSKYSEDRVLDYFRRWAETAVGWLKERRDTNGLNFFWRPLDEMAEGDEVRIARETDQKKSEEPEIPAIEVESLMAANAARVQAGNAKLLEAAKAQEEFEAAHRDEI